MKILLTTLHAKYSHASLALPCLAACCRDIAGLEITIREWTINEQRAHILRLIIAEQADLIAFSCYIWNIGITLQLASDIKKISPATVIVLGGPEASYGIFELMHANPAIDFVIKGEGEAVFRDLLIQRMAGSDNGLPTDVHAECENLFFRDGDDIVSGPPSRRHLEPDSIPSPFEAGLVDLSKPLIYYETSRGCPFSCAFCLSSVEGAVRSFSMERIKRDLLFLLQHKVAQIKLVDRTFNYDARRADEIWDFILEHNQGSHVHFEIAADLLTNDNLWTLARVGESTFRFEIGVQSASENTLGQVGRTTSLEAICANVRRLRRETSIELHLDLLAGLPGEDYAGFLRSLQLVADLQPHEIQIEPLKVLKGSPMREIAERQEYRFSDSPPYTILHTPWLSFTEICRIETIGRLLDLFHKHGGMPMAFEVLQRRHTFSAILDAMARRAGDENLSALSCRRVFELFARLAPPSEDARLQTGLHDALFFDYCRCEMPLKGKLPSFAAAHQSSCSWPAVRDLPANHISLAGCRVKGFCSTFQNDYHSGSRRAIPVAYTFIYSTSAGQGLQVLVLS